MLLRLEHIVFGYSKDKNLLNDISIELEPGKIYALMGANGAGKTTLFNLVTGFLKLQSGNIILKGKNVNNFLSFARNRRGIGRTFQDLRLISKLTVKENVLLAMHDNPTDNWFRALLPPIVFRGQLKELDEKADTIVSQYFLGDVRYSLAGEISYGQQKLLNLACCMANNADMLLLDEPVAGINPVYREKIAEILKKLKDSGKTILLIEHNTEFIDEVVDRIFFLVNGEVFQYQNVEIMRSDARVLEAYL